MALLTSCNGEKPVKEWSDRQINEWFVKSKWHKLALAPDQSTNIREFVEQNILNPNEWDAAYEFLRKGGLKDYELGSLNLTETGTRAIFSEYTTKEDAHFEAHKKFVDIQILASGKEYIRVGSMDNITAMVTPYDEKRDIEFFDKAEYTAHILDGSNFMTLFPCDAHMPCMQVDGAMEVRKVVIKIPYVE